jgi:1-phosphofructokinase
MTTNAVVTVTPNPSVDRTILVDGVATGAVNRALGSRVDPGGKGVNVSRALTAHGRPTTAVLPLGGPEGTMLRALLADAGVTVAAVPIRGATRSNISLVRPDGTTTKINEPGPQLDAEEAERFFASVVAELGRSPEWLVASGSLPPGLGAEFYARLVGAGREFGVPVAIDTTHGPLVAAAAAGADLLKPNDEELAQAVGRRLVTLGDVLRAAEELRAPDGQVIVSLGARGALLVDAAGATLASVAAHSQRDPVSTVGAGDSLLAGFLHAGTRDVAALAAGVAWGTAAVALPGSQVPTPEHVAGIEVVLSEPPLALELVS